VLLTFRQLQLLPTGGVSSDANSDNAQAEQQQQQQQQGSAQLPTACSSSSICSETEPSLEPHLKNPTTTSGPIASTSSSSTPTAATSALTSSIKQLALGSSNSAAAAEPATALPAAALPAAAAAAPVIERRLEAVLLSTAPRLLVIDDFFDAGLCEALMALARGKLVRSRVASGAFWLWFVLHCCCQIGFACCV
jgi:hypothetical protein